MRRRSIASNLVFSATTVNGFSHSLLIEKMSSYMFRDDTVREMHLDNWTFQFNDGSALRICAPSPADRAAYSLPTTWVRYSNKGIAGLSGRGNRTVIEGHMPFGFAYLTIA